MNVGKLTSTQIGQRVQVCPEGYIYGSKKEINYSEAKAEIHM